MTYMIFFPMPYSSLQKKPFGYVGVLQEENVEQSDDQRNVLNQLRDWDLWCVSETEYPFYWVHLIYFYSDPLKYAKFGNQNDALETIKTQQ